MAAAFMLHRSSPGMTKALVGGSREPVTRALVRGRYWYRTSDLFGVNEALYP